MIRITLNDTDFAQLVRGRVVEKEDVEIALADIGQQLILNIVTAAFNEVGPGQPTSPTPGMREMHARTEGLDDLPAEAALFDVENPLLAREVIGHTEWDVAETLLAERHARGREDGLLIVIAALLAGRTDAVARSYVFEKMVMAARLDRDGRAPNLLDQGAVRRLTDALENHDDGPITHLAVESKNWR